MAAQNIKSSYTKEDLVACADGKLFGPETARLPSDNMLMVDRIISVTADGGEFGMGAEIGISTDKLHARGPMGLEELTSYKHVIWGEGQVMGGEA